MFIQDINGQQREIKSFKVITHNRENESICVTPENIDGELVMKKEVYKVETDENFVEVIILGKSGREWKEWYPLKVFEDMNPGVEV